MITVRIATEDDIDILYELIMAIAVHHDQQQYVLTSKTELRESGFGSHPKFGVLLAEYDSNIAGYVSFTWNYSIWAGSNYMNIDDLYIWEQYRGKGIGEKLMHKAKELCTKKRINRIKWEVEKDNTKAIKFYERLGAKLNVKGIFKWDNNND